MKLYQCSVCGNIVDLIKDGGGELVCCGQSMEEVVANSSDGAREKHVPVIKKEDGKIIVEVGEVLHPMTKEHYIMWIAVVGNNYFEKKMLNPDEEPKAEFIISDISNITVYAYCNIHGLFKNK